MKSLTDKKTKKRMSGQILRQKRSLSFCIHARKRRQELSQNAITISSNHNNTNVFVAECKFWNGQEKFLETITQLLSYLTWRDSKAAIIIFVKNKEISSVLETVKQVTPQHPNYLGFVNQEDTSWFNYRFHINDDPNREVHLAIMLYHIPPVYGGRMKDTSTQTS